MKKFLTIFICTVLLTFVFVPAAAEHSPAEVRLPVVMYHHVSQNPGKWNDYVISPEELESDLKYLKENGWESVSMAELLAWYRGEFTMPEKPFMITFDDGFESTVAYAEPLLEKYGYRGIVAVIGSVCEKFTQCGEHDPELSNMSWADAVAAAGRGVLEVQCHTWDLHGLGARTGCNKISWENTETYRTRLTEDLSRFLSESETQGLSLTMTIAYPYGMFCPETTQVVKELGFQAAFTCAEEINLLTGEGEELYHLSRYNRPHGRTSWEFFSKWEPKA